MATRPYVPRADGESSIGVVGKKWGKIYAYDIDEKTNLGNNKSLGYRQPSNAQTVGDVRYHATLPTGWYLECTTAGTTGSGALTITSPTVGGTVSDGTVTWTIRKNASTQDLTGYLPLSGGKLSGYIYGDSGKPLYFKAAPQADGGPSLALYGLDIQESQPIIGGFEIIAMGKDRTTTKSLLGYNNGNLTWCGNSLDKSAVVAESLGGNGYIKYASGLIVQWGGYQATGGKVYELTFPTSFSSGYFGFSIIGSTGYATSKPNAIFSYNTYYVDTSKIKISSAIYENGSKSWDHWNRWMAIGI